MLHLGFGMRSSGSRSWDLGLSIEVLILQEWSRYPPNLQTGTISLILSSFVMSRLVDELYTRPNIMMHVHLRHRGA